MKEFIKGKEEGVFILTNHVVENIRQDESFNSNFLAKRLSEQCEVYQNIIHNIL